MGDSKAEKNRREDLRKLHKKTDNGYSDGCLYKKCRVKFEVEEGRHSHQQAKDHGEISEAAYMISETIECS